MNYTATYSPDDNKLRLYATSRLGPETYARVKAAGFKWAPKQDLFVAPTWSPEREDLLIELAGEVDDEDKSLVERAEERAERFEDYSDKRMAEAEGARKAVAAIADNIPFGQPILVGHHSERHARRDAERIENGMRKVVKLWETSGYWKVRAEGALRHAKYKELPAVRHRRIKTLTAELRKVEKSKQECDIWLKLWTECGNEPDAELQKAVALRIANMCWLHLPRKEGDDQTFPHQPTAYDAINGCHPKLYAPRTIAEVVEHALKVYPATIERQDRWIAHLQNRIAYETAMLDEQIGIGETGSGMSGRFDLKAGGKAFIGGEWLVILKVNKAEGAVNSVTTTPPSGVHWTSRWKYGVEKIKDYQPPTEAMVAKVKKATALPPICNYPGEGFREMTNAEWSARKKWSDFSYIGVMSATTTAGKHRVRQMPSAGQYWKAQQVFITDAKVARPPAPEPKEEPMPVERVTSPQYAKPCPPAGRTAFDDIRDSLKGGVKVVSAPQLFPTPPAIAARMVALAEIEEEHRILEPSAGTGVLLKALPVGPLSQRVAVEINPSLARQLAFCAAVRCANFLECHDLGEFDRIVMNPPFERGADIKHIEHALTMLKPSGRLVAICANGPRQQERLQPLATHWEALPAGTFNGTNVSAALMVIKR